MLDIAIRNGQFELAFDVSFHLGPITLAASGFAGVYTQDNPAWS